MKLKQILATILISGLTTFAVIWGYSKWSGNANTYGGQSTTTLPQNYRLTDFTDAKSASNGPGDFTGAALASIPTVVHIKTKINAKQISNNTPRSRQQDPFSDFFGDDMFNQLFGNPNMTREQRASGSGVIISQDGYIVTNNHVIEKADEVMVTLSNRRNYTAKVVGTDPSYDLAVIKIEAAGLPYLVYGNSDDVQIGQWVLAIGYPLNLEATATAGIVSAKARSLGLNKDRAGSVQGGVESFIQTDAAVNAGNSGGALVNTDGRLIGINSAIASPTGYYSGYSYAIPVNIARKVVDDIIKYGTVQRAYLGISYPYSSLSEKERQQANIPDITDGIYVIEVSKDGGAYEAGIRKGDIIKTLAGVNVNSGAEVNEIVSRYKPGDKIAVTYVRSNKLIQTSVSLRNRSGNFDVIKLESGIEKLGGEFATLGANEARQFGVQGGVILKKISPTGVLADQTTIKENFIIIKVNNKVVKTVEELREQVNGNKDIVFTGFFPGYDGLYDYQVSLD